MLLKILIVTLLLVMMLVLGMAWRALSVREDPARMNRLLTIRVILAVLIILLLIVGALTGQLHPGAPWQR